MLGGERARGEEGGHDGGRAAMGAGGRRVEQVRFKRKLGRAGDKVSPNHFGPNGKGIKQILNPISILFLTQARATIFCSTVSKKGLGLLCTENV